MRNHRSRCAPFSTHMMQTVCYVAALCLLVACGISSTTPTRAPINIAAPFAAPATAAPTSRSDGLSDDEVRTLASLAQVDDYPLYTLHYYGAYSQRSSSIERNMDSAWACSLFAALGDTGNLLYGRNFGTIARLYSCSRLQPTAMRQFQWLTLLTWDLQAIEPPGCSICHWPNAVRC